MTTLDRILFFLGFSVVFWAVGNAVAWVLLWLGGLAVSWALVRINRFELKE